MITHMMECFATFNADRGQVLEGPKGMSVQYEETIAKTCQRSYHTLGYEPKLHACETVAGTTHCYT